MKILDTKLGPAVEHSAHNGRVYLEMHKKEVQKRIAQVDTAIIANRDDPEYVRELKETQTQNKAELAAITVLITVRANAAEFVTLVKDFDTEFKTRLSQHIKA